MNAVGSDNSHNHGTEPLAGLCLGVPVELPHLLLDLLDKILGSMVRLCITT